MIPKEMHRLLAGSVLIVCLSVCHASPLTNLKDDSASQLEDSEVRERFVGAMRKRRSLSSSPLTYSMDDLSTGSLVKQCVGEYEIPVAFHVVHYEDGRDYVTPLTLNKQLEVLQAGFNESMFKFKMHSMEWISDDTWANDCQSERKRAEYSKNPSKVLNVYICPLYNSDYLYGITQHPWEAPEGDRTHGVIIDTGSIPGGSGPGLDMGKNLILEVGYFFGLFWIFEGACNSQNDKVDDTPAQMEVYGCPRMGVKDTCPTMPGKDLVNNYMGFTTDACKESFTAGQIARMNTMFLKYKPTLARYSALKPCELDGVFRWKNGRIYMFSGDKFFRYSEVTRGFDAAYPQLISAFWKGVPNDIDDVTRNSQGKTVFLKNGMEYEFDDAQLQVVASERMDDRLKGVKVTMNYVDGLEYYFTADDHVYKFNVTDQQIVSYNTTSQLFNGVPQGFGTALTWYNGDVYFFKKQHYYRWSVGTNTVVKETIDEWWKKSKEDLTDYAALWHGDGQTYFFRGQKYWRFNDRQFQVQVGYPKNITSQWSSVPENIDDAFLWSQDREYYYTYFFKGDTYYKYNENEASVEQSGKINALWKGVPNDIDAVFTYCNGVTYFFKGSDYYRFNDTSMSVDAGYPKKISQFWKGVPNNLSSVFRYANGRTYFFKGDQYFRYDDTAKQVDVSYPQPIANWRGVLVDEM